MSFRATARGRSCARRAWGVVLGVVAHTKGLVYMLALAAASGVAAARGHRGVGEQIPVWLAIGAVDAAALIALCRPGVVTDARVRHGA